MRVYTLLNDSTFEKMVKQGEVISPCCGYYPTINFSGTALLRFGGEMYQDTFSKDLYDDRPIFFRFAIDAIRFYIQEQDWHEYNYFCVFDIPEEFLEKGFGSYRRCATLVTPVYMAKGKITKDYFKSYTKCRKGDLRTWFDYGTLFDYLKEDLEDSVIWHSTVGKICTMCIDTGSSFRPICGSKRVGGFMYHYANDTRGSYNKEFLPAILLKATTKEETKEILAQCYELNRQCYDELKSLMTEDDLTRFSQIANQFHKKEVKTQIDAGKLFNEIENICYPQDKLDHSSAILKKIHR